MRENDKIDLRKYISGMKAGKWWGILVFVLIMALAITYSFIKMPLYDSQASMLIEEDGDDGTSKLGAMSSLARSFSIGGFGKSSVDNEMLILYSHSLKKAMVNRLGLNRSYVEKRGLKKNFLYKKSPVVVDAPGSMFDTLQTTMKMRIELDKGKVDIKVTKGFFNSVIATRENVELPCVVNTPYGDFQVLKSPKYYNPKEKRTIDVIISGDDFVVGSLKKNLAVKYAAKKGDGIYLSITDVSKERGRDILNTLMALYNERRSNRKGERAVAEVTFLNERIAQLNTELVKSEEDLATFKRDKDMLSVGTEASILLAQDVEADSKLLAMQVEEMTLKSILEQLNDPEKRYTLIPLAESFGDGNAAAIMSQYNSLILKRMDMASSAKAENAAMVKLTEQIDAVRENVVENVKRLQANWKIRYGQLSKESGKYKARINSMPQYEREYIDLSRNRELKNALYVFLLEKRESALLKQNNSQELGFVFEPAYSEVKSNKSKVYMIIVAGVLFALIAGLVASYFTGHNILLRKNGYAKIGGDAKE